MQSTYSNPRQQVTLRTLGINSLKKKLLFLLYQIALNIQFFYCGEFGVMATLNFTVLAIPNRREIIFNKRSIWLFNQSALRHTHPILIYILMRCHNRIHWCNHTHWLLCLFNSDLLYNGWTKCNYPFQWTIHRRTMTVLNILLHSSAVLIGFVLLLVPSVTATYVVSFGCHVWMIH